MSGRDARRYFRDHGPDAFGLNFRDFIPDGRDGADVAKRIEAMGRGPATISNLNVTGTALNESHIKPYDLVALPSLRVAVLSLIDPVYMLPAWRSRVAPADEAVAKVVADLQRLPEAEAPDAIVLLARYSNDYETALALARETFGVAFAVGVEDDAARDHAAQTVKTWDGSKAFAAPAPAIRGVEVLEVHLSLERDGPFYTTVDAAAKYVPLNCSIEEDATSYAEMVSHYAAMQSILNETVGVLAHHVEGDRVSEICDEAVEVNGAEICGCRVAECTAGNLFADAMRYASNAQIALINSGSIRASIDAGAVSESEVPGRAENLNCWVESTSSPRRRRDSARSNPRRRRGVAATRFDPIHVIAAIRFDPPRYWRRSRSSTKSFDLTRCPGRCYERPARTRFPA